MVNSVKFTALAIIKNNDTVLALRVVNRLSFPGGKNWKKEKPEQTAARELFEETGVIITPKSLIQLGNRKHPITGKHIYYCAGSFNECSGEATNREPHKHSFVGFIPIDDFIAEAGKNNIFLPAYQFLLK